MTNKRIQELIKECQAEAQKSIDSGNPPFGCVITATLLHGTGGSDKDYFWFADIKKYLEANG